jgi:hypothetical protein
MRLYAFEDSFLLVIHNHDPGVNDPGYKDPSIHLSRVMRDMGQTNL